MLTKIRTLASLYRDLGLRWSVFRLAYAFRFRSGLIRLQMQMGEWEYYKKHVRMSSVHPKFFPFVGEGSSHPESWNQQVAIGEADKILNGEIKYFSHQFIQTGFPPNWCHDYVTLSRVSGEESLPLQPEILQSQRMLPQNDMNKHWSQISHDSSTDIKFIWEPNRFAFVYTLVRAYTASQDEKYVEAFWALIEDWAEHNPPNTGPNWMDGQEIALRLMSWTFGYNYFLNSPSTTPQRKENFILYVAAQAERIYKNISYAISTRSNHTISEAFGLWLVGLLFPELKDSEKYLSMGRKLLEQEAAAQILPDGSYSMYSLNYHRFILHIYLYAIRLGEINQSPFSFQLKNLISKSIEYLNQLIDPQTGQMPVYGSNDGALVLPLNNCDFTDYRPLLQLGWYITKGERLFEPGTWDEDIFWLCGETSTAEHAKNAKENKNLSDLRVLSGSKNDGGTYIIRNMNSKAILRCTDFRSRPSHADQLHMDLWIHGRNIACDAGTYLYSGEGIWRNGLAHALAHNTVTVDHRDQMAMVSRFTWTNWSKGKVLQNKENLWQGEHDGYKPVIHKRTVMMFEDDRWLVIDNLIANEPHHYSLHWLLNDSEGQQLAAANGLLLNLTHSGPSNSRVKVQVGLVDGDSNFSIVRADSNSTRGWRSRYYGHKEPAISMMLEAQQPQACFWTYFGFESDLLEMDGYSLRIKTPDINSSINLDALSLNTPL